MKEKFLLKVRYMAIQVDNYQGGSGRPFEDFLYIDIDKDTSASGINRIATQSIRKLNKSKYLVEQAVVRSIELIVLTRSKKTS